jgi:hypothetical protein
MNHRTHRRGFTRIDLTISVVLVVLLGGGFIVAQQATNEEANRVKCAANLRNIGQALLLYSNENRGAFPRTRYQVNAPATAFTNWKSAEPFAADGPKVNDVTAALFLLIRTQDISVYTFICPSSNAYPINIGKKAPPPAPAAGGAAGGTVDPVSAAAQAKFAAAEAARRPTTGPAGVRQPIGDPVAESATQMSNFPSMENLSYSYANPYPNTIAAQNGYKMNSGIGAEFAIVADLNPGGAAVAKLTVDQMPPMENRRAAYVPFAGNPWKFSDEQRSANSPNHGGFGQNVLYGDGRVSWQASPFVGTDRDNIYTRDFSKDQEPGSDPVLGSPMGPQDSVLLPAAKPADKN